MAAWKIAPALACGNTVVLKPAETTPLTALKLAELIRDAELPPGVVNIVTGAGETGAALVDHPDVDKIAFTGSTEVGKLIQRKARRDEEALHARARRQSREHHLRGRAARSGGRRHRQRHLLQPGPRLLRRLAAAGAGIRRRASDRKAQGPHGDADRRRSARQEHRHRRDQFRGAAREDRGLSPDRPGRRRENATRAPARVPEHGYWCRPTLFTGVSQSHRIVQEEIFGPVLAIQTFRTSEEAVEKANNTPYGLSGGVWTDKGAKIFKMTAQLRAGVVWANTFNKFDPTSPVRRLQGKRHGPRRRSARARCLRGAHLMSARAGKRPNGALAASQGARQWRAARACRSRRPTSCTSTANSRAASRAATTRSSAAAGWSPTSAVRAARTSATPWSRRGTHLRRGRRRARICAARCCTALAEMLEGRHEQFTAELVLQGGTRSRAAAEVTATIDRLVYYAGWADKYQQVFSSVNPVATSHFNFSMLEPTGVVAIIAPEASGLLGLVSNVAPAVAGGNTCCRARVEDAAARSGEPGRGAAGLGHTRRCRQHAHRLARASSRSSSPRTWTSTRSCTATRMRTAARRVQLAAADNIKRVVLRAGLDWNADESQSPYLHPRHAGNQDHLAPDRRLSRIHQRMFRPSSPRNTSPRR